MGYVYCACCSADCMDGPLCLPCEDTGCDADGSEPRCICPEGHFPLDCPCPEVTAS